MPFVLNEAQADLLRDEKSYLTRAAFDAYRNKEPG